MADNVTLNTGSGGDTVAADDISGVKFQRVKLVVGADGVNGGDVASGNPLPISDAGGSVSIDDGGNVLSIDDGGGSITVDGTVAVSGSVAVTGTFYQATQPVSASSLPLPSGASTAAKQPALGTAGTASADVITVQGIASMTALKTDGSAVTQPVSFAAAASGGMSVTNVRSAASTNATNIKASAGTLYGWWFQNNGTVQQFVRLYNLSSTPTPSSSTILIGPIVLNPGDSVGQDYGPSGVACGTGIGFCVTGGQSATDNTNATVDIVLGHIRWI